MKPLHAWADRASGGSTPDCGHTPASRGVSPLGLRPGSLSLPDGLSRTHSDSYVGGTGCRGSTTRAAGADPADDGPMLVGPRHP